MIGVRHFVRRCGQNRKESSTPLRFVSEYSKAHDSESYSTQNEKRATDCTDKHGFLRESDLLASLLRVTRLGK